MQRIVFLAALAIMMLALACGGGGGGTTTPSATPSGSLTTTIPPTVTPTPTATPSVPPPTGTAAYINAKVVGYPTGAAISGATLTNASGAVLATSDASGAISATVYPGDYTLTVSATGGVPQSYSATIAAGVTYNLGTVYMVTAGTATGTVGGTGLNLGITGSATVDIPAGNLPSGTQVTIAYIPPDTLDIAMPGAFPSQLAIVGGISIITPTVSGKVDRAAGDIFVRLDNKKGLPGGTTVPVGKYDKTTNSWQDSTPASVTSDGRQIEFEVSTPGDYVAGMPVVAPGAQDRGLYEVSMADGNFLQGEPHVDITSGNMMIGVDLPPVTAFGSEHFLSLVYESDTVRSNRLLELIVKERPDTLPDAEFCKILFGGFGTIQEAMLTDSEEEVLARVRVPVTKELEDGSKEMLPSGPYPVEFRFAQYYSGKLATSTDNSFVKPAPGVVLDISSGPVPFETSTSETEGKKEEAEPEETSTDLFNSGSGRLVPVHNLTASPFGKGWHLAGLERLFFNEDKTAAALVGRRGNRPLIFKPDGIYYVENYRYLVDEDAADITETFSAQRTHTVAIDGDYMYIAVSSRASSLTPTTAKIYRVKDPLAHMANGPFPDEPIAGEELEYITEVELVDPKGDPMAVNPVNGDLYICQGGEVKRWDGASWSSICDIAYSEPGLPVASNIRINATGDIFVLGYRNIWKVAAGTTTPVSVFWHPNRLVGLALDANGNYYTAESDIRAIYKGWMDGDTPMKETLLGPWGEEIRPGDRIPLQTSEPLGTVRDLDFDSLGNMYFVTDRALYKVGTDMFVEQIGVSNLSCLPADLQMNKERDLANEAGFMDPNFLTVGLRGIIYLGGLGAYNFLRVWPMTDGVWKSVGGEYSELVKEGDKYIRTPGTDQTVYEYDADGFLTAVKFPHGRNVIVTYTGSTAEDKRVYRYKIVGVCEWAFNFSGPITITDDYARVTSIFTNADGTVREIKTPDGASSTYQYDGDGFLTRRVSPGINSPSGNYYNSIDYEYDGDKSLTGVTYNGSYKQTIAPEGISSTINQYAGQGTWPSLAPSVTQVEATIQGDNEPLVTFKRKGMVLEVEQNSKAIKKEFDDKARLEREEYPDGKVVTYEWNETDAKPKKIITMFRGDTWEAVFNEEGRLSKVVNPIGEEKYYTYDELGRVEQINEYTSGLILRYEYDPLIDLPTRQVRNGNTEYQAEYNSRGLLTNMFKFGEETVYTYNDIGKITKIVRGPETTNYTWTNCGHLTSVYNSAQSVTYDVSPQHTSSLIGGHVPGFVITAIYRGTGTIRLTYDLLYNPVELESPEGVYQVNMDTNGLPTGMTYPDYQSTVAFTYDDNGRCTQKAFNSPSGPRTLKYTFDALGNMTSANTDKALLSMTYDLLGNITGMTYMNASGSDAVWQCYFGYQSTNGRLESLTMPFTNSIYYFDYKGFDMTLEKVRHQDGATSVETTLATISRNVLNQITEIKYVGNTVTYTRDTQGRITFSTGPGFNKMYTQTSQGCTGWVDADGSHDITLDAAGRVTQVTHPAGSPHTWEVYAYDANNNRTYSQTRGMATYTNDILNDDAAYVYAYDANARLVSMTPKGAPHVLKTFAYDAEGNLTEVKIYTGQDVASGVAKTVTYEYNALGLRVNRKVNGGLPTYYLYDSAKRLVGMQIGINPVMEFSHADDSCRPLTMIQSGVIYEYYQDAFRNIIAVASEGGVQASYTYDTYGRLVASTGTSDNPFRYAGAEYDTETGLYYMKHRWYDPEIGRFITPDPYLFSAGYNLYAYAKGNPYRYYDPEGREDEEYSDEWDGQIEFNDPYDYAPETTPAENSHDTNRPSSDEYDPTGYGQTRVDKAQNVNTQEHINDSVVDGAKLGGEQVLQEGAKQGIKYGLATRAGKWLATAAPRVMGWGARAVPFVNVALWTKDILDVGAYAYGQYEYYKCAPSE